MSQEPRSTVHYVMVTTAGFSQHADWSALRRAAGETNSVVSAVVLDGEHAITIAPAQPARTASSRPLLPRPTREAGNEAWATLLDSIFQAQAAIPTIDRTEVHLFGDAAAGRKLSSLVRQDPSITIRMRDSRPDGTTAVRGPKQPSIPLEASTPNAVGLADPPGGSLASAEALQALRARLAGGMKAPANGPTTGNSATGGSRPPAAMPVPAPPRQNPLPSRLTSPIVRAAPSNHGATAKESFKRLGIMLGVSVPLWIFTPVIASFGSLVVPGLSAAVFASSENGGRTAGDSPLTLYGHLAWVLGLTCVVIFITNLLIGLADEKFAWLPMLFTIGGLVAFFWLVISRGGNLWMWDVAPAAGVAGYVCAQLLTRMRRP